MNWAPLLLYLAAIALAPLLGGVIAKTKAFFAGRTGAPLLQGYFDLAKLLRKGAVYSATTSWVFRAGPVLSIGAVAVALALVPMGGTPAPLAFPGDFLVLAYLLALARFFTVIAALDTGSAFEGMGASREAQFSALAEPGLVLCFFALARNADALSLSAGLGALSPGAWRSHAAVLALVAAALFIVFLAENARIPVDDPTTHLELTMIHEVMVLDHGGPDLALIEAASWLKLWVLGALVVGVVVPVRTGVPVMDGGVFVAAMLLLGVAVGVVESAMARLRLLRVPQLLVASGVLAALATVLISG
ncbi:MAG: NADH-quinone oxidoreductase subunit H [Thermoanaerobaculaceae bacterium]|nr:NADH-quinone oxidoreductase subunit H [Thermoanaerobaculaceae bacterium]TAM57015.1 MAG: hydrogenase [Acidobacteriota bacterium]